MTISLKNTGTFRKIALALAVLVALDGVSTYLALSLGYREGNPLVNYLGGPAASLFVRFVILYTAITRSYTWDKPNRIMIICFSYLIAVLIHAIVVAHNFYLSALIFF